MLYISTRGNSQKVNASNAVIKGIADDGGLFVPENMPKLSKDISEFVGMSYNQVAYEIMKEFFPDFSESEFKEAIEIAYNNKFDDEKTVVLKNLDNLAFLELFHGPTLAFKDMALSVLPELMRLSLQKENIKENVLIITATSGDTGKAALEGFRNKDNIKIIVFYPKDGVSKMQWLQMTTEPGENALVYAVNGNFDDAQSGVKTIFTDKEFAKEISSSNYRLSSANSINIGRLVPQIVYYVYSYANLVSDKKISLGDKINVCVPTGNFGNILAAWYAKQMGVPINKFICASNENNVLYDFFKTGTYDKNRELKLTTSPSMDILISSNFERLLFEVSGRNSETTAKLMSDLVSSGSYTVDENIKNSLNEFYSMYATEEQVKETINETYEKYNYVLDTHTAVAAYAAQKYQEETGDNTVTIVASTASPFKFSEDVCNALNIDVEGKDVFEIAETLAQKTNLNVPQNLASLSEKKPRFLECCEKDEMYKVVSDFIKL